MNLRMEGITFENDASGYARRQSDDANLVALLRIVYRGFKLTISTAKSVTDPLPSMIAATAAPPDWLSSR